MQYLDQSHKCLKVDAATLGCFSHWSCGEYLALKFKSDCSTKFKLVFIISPFSFDILTFRIELK